jgi:hypothetical protein
MRSAGFLDLAERAASNAIAFTSRNVPHAVVQDVVTLVVAENPVLHNGRL